MLVEYRALSATYTSFQRLNVASSFLETPKVSNLFRNVCACCLCCVCMHTSGVVEGGRGGTPFPTFFTISKILSRLHFLLQFMLQFPGVSPLRVPPLHF